MAGPHTVTRLEQHRNRCSKLPGTHSRTSRVAVIDDDGDENAENTEMEASIEEVDKIEAEVAPTASATLTPCSSGTTSYLTLLLNKRRREDCLG